MEYQEIMNILSLQEQAVRQLMERNTARSCLLEYIKYTKDDYVVSDFSIKVCESLDKFLEDVENGKRPILILQAPPQHGKSEIVSRKFPAYILGKFPNKFIGCASYNDQLANKMAQHVRRNIDSAEHKRLFKPKEFTGRFDTNKIGEFSSPNGTGNYMAVGIGSGLTGNPLDIGIIDDPVKNEKEALSLSIKEGHKDWYQTVFMTRMSENSGQIIMATSWADDDLTNWLVSQYKDDHRLTVLKFPAIDENNKALVPELHSIEKLQETRKLMSEYWWNALYQQNPRPLGGNIFLSTGVRHYNSTSDIPRIDKMIASWDCTFKDSDSTDFVVGQVWAKSGANAYLIYQIRAKMSFNRTIQAMESVKEAFPRIREFLIEDKANGPAIIDTLKCRIPMIIPVEPDGSKLARASAITALWEAGNVYLPRIEDESWVKAFISEVLAFPATFHDDQVDAMTQALRRLYPLHGEIKVSQAMVNKVLRQGKT